MSKFTLTIPIQKKDISSLRIKDVVYLNGVVYTARDGAHLRIAEYLRQGKALPEEFLGRAIFHAGPVVKRQGEEWKLWVIGPTTSIRMEPYADLIGKLGIRVIVGKGGMGENTSKALKQYGGVYLLAAPGCGARHADSMEKILRVHWVEDLGVPEAMWVLRVKDWGPLTVGMDSEGNSIFRDVKRKANEKIKSIFPIK